MGNLGVNFLADAFVNVEAMAASLWAYLDRAPNDALHISSGARVEQAFTFAKMTRARYPNMQVIFRKLPNDNQHTKMTPAAWFDSFAPWSDGGNLILAMMNESGVNDIPAQNAWLTAGIELCGKAGIRCVAPDVQTHNRFTPAAFDSTLRMLAKYRGWFTAHYYFDPPTINSRGSVIDPGSPIDPVLDTVEAYCAAKGISGIQFGVTELGFAYHLDPYRGYQGRISGKAYGGQLVQVARAKPKTHFFVYGWGGQAPWELFDISGDKDVQDAIVAYHQEPTPVPTPIPPILLPDIGGVSMTVTEGLNLRASIPGGTIIRTMRAGETVTGYPSSAQSAGSYEWIIVQDAAGKVGYAASKYLTAVSVPPAPDAWTVRLDVPYISQTSSTASKSNNDCGVASLLMLTGYWMRVHTRIQPSLPTVDMLIPYTPLGLKPPPKGLTFNELDTLAEQLGFKTTYRQPTRMDDIRASLDDGYPIAVLLDYAKYAPGNASIAHICVVIGYSSGAFLTHDPYVKGMFYRVTADQLNEAMRSSPGNSLGWQAMTLAV